MTETAGRVALVTGGGNGIGRGLAMALAMDGASVAVADIMKDDAETVATEIKKAGGKAMAVACDVSDRASVRKMKAEANQAFGRVSLLFANAGVTSFARADSITDSEMDWVIQVNLMGIANCVQIFLPDMTAARAGHIVATSSCAGLIPTSVPVHVPYTASKAGIIGFILNLRCELKGTGVEATLLCPGGVQTHILNSPKYRPTRFGGPAENPVLPSVDPGLIKYRSPEQVAQMVLEAVRENRSLVVTDANFRQAFIEQYVNVVLQAFDDVVAFDKKSASA